MKNAKERPRQKGAYSTVCNCAAEDALTKLFAK